MAVTLIGDANGVDSRAYQHGISVVKDHDNNHWAIWSSSPGNPPEGETKLVLADGTKCSYFTHDIYYSLISPENLRLEAQPLVALPEAQEPVDVAVMRNGSVAITFEDGSESDIANCDGVIQQRYKVYQQFPQNAVVSGTVNFGTVKTSGAHSGHIAAVADNFVIFFSEGWVDGGGVNGAGTANDIYVETISAEGEYRWHTAISKDAGWPRDWWPLVAGSSQNALLLWQRAVEKSNYASLMLSVYDPAGNKIVKPITVLKENLQYYHYDVQYLNLINRFLVVGNYLGDTTAGNSIVVRSPKLFAFLLDVSGEVVDYWEAKSECSNCGSYVNFNLVRESKPATVAIEGEDSGGSVNVAYPIKPNGVISLMVYKDKIEFKNNIKQQHFWFPMGADGFFSNSGEAIFLNLTPTGVKLIKPFEHL